MTGSEFVAVAVLAAWLSGIAGLAFTLPRLIAKGGEGAAEELKAARDANPQALSLFLALMIVTWPVSFLPVFLYHLWRPEEDR